MKVAIIGGGIMGCTTALTLAKRGVSVVVLERAVPGAEASSAAAGILGAQVESRGEGAMLSTFVRARAAYPAWADELRDATSIDVGYKRSGVLRIARTEAEHDANLRDVTWQRAEGLRAELLDGHGAREVEPELAPDVSGAAYFPDDGQVNPPALLRALVQAVASARVTVRSGATVQRVLVEKSRCVGVGLEDGDLFADATVLAAGSWSSLVPGAPVPKVRPARGQYVLLEERPPKVRSIVFGRGGYVVPRGDGRVLCGSTTEFVGFRREVTAGGVQAILSHALSSVPSLAHAELASMWSNFRPHIEGDRALMGPSELPGLFAATGHFRNGILLAKLTADAVTDAILA